MICLNVGPEEHGDTSLKQWPQLSHWEEGDNKTFPLPSQFVLVLSAKMNTRVFPRN